MENENGQVQEIEERIKTAWHEIVTMEERLKALPPQIDTFNQSLVEVQQTLTNSKEQFANINSHYADYFAKVDPTIKTKLETVTEHHANVEQFLKASTELKKDLEDFKEFIYGNESLKKVGFKKDIENLFEKNKTSNEKMYNEWSESFQTLYNKIEGLLPGATATGLSKAYQDQKINYKIPVIMWSGVFGLTVAGMMIFGLYFYKEVTTFEDSLRHILARLPFFIPAIWLAIFASKQQSQYKRLQQEYVYKETLSKSYESYKREIDQLPDGDEKTELQQKLINSMVEMCGYNPSMTLEHKSHEEKPPFPGSGIINGLTPSKKKKAGTQPEA